MTFRNLLRKWNQSKMKGAGLDSIFGKVPTLDSLLRERINWLNRLVHWIRNPGISIALTQSAREGKLPVVRIRFILQMLDQNSDLKLNVARVLRSIVKDTHGLELFMNVGIPNEQGFIGEVVERLHLFLPQAPDDENLVSLFSETFRFQGDAHWIKQIPPEVFGQIVELFHFAENVSDTEWNLLIKELKDALVLLGQLASSIGLSRFIRNRLKTGLRSDFRDLPFYSLPHSIDKLLESAEREKVIESYRAFCKNVERCFESLDLVDEHFKDQGVSIALVYQVERLKALIHRLSTLARLYVGYERDPAFIHDFFAHLVEENYRAKSIRGLLSDNITLVCHKIVETNAETGDHYISRDQSEQKKIFKSAAGGGMVTGLTTLVKVILHHLSLAPFVWGLFASLNYAASFLMIQFLGFTLATKQPAMTATHLASKLDSRAQDLTPVIDEILHLLRSQITTVFGNMFTVIPSVLFLNLLLSLMGIQLLDAHHAVDMMDGFSLFGRTPFLAAWTGVLLWASSVFSGLFSNWFSFRKLPSAIEHLPRVVFVFGEERAKRWVRFISEHMGGLAANISLGFLLGMSLPVGAFFGIPLDVRHITLSTGIMTVACASLGTDIFSQAIFWKACGGLFSMAVLNLGVSFSLALFVAIWAKKTNAPSRRQIYLGLIKKLTRSPLLLFLPEKSPAPISLASP